MIPHNVSDLLNFDSKCIFLYNDVCLPFVVRGKGCGIYIVIIHC